MSSICSDTDRLEVLLNYLSSLIKDSADFAKARSQIKTRSDKAIFSKKPDSRCQRFSVSFFGNNCQHGSLKIFDVLSFSVVDCAKSVLGSIQIMMIEFVGDNTECWTLAASWPGVINPPETSLGKFLIWSNLGKHISLLWMSQTLASTTESWQASCRK